MKITPKIKKIIESNPIALATIDKNKPYVITVACCKIIGSDKILITLITDNFMKRTIKNISDNDNVALTVWNKQWEGYQFLGTCEYFKTGKWAKYVKNLGANKNMPAKGAILVKIKKIIKSK